MCICFSFLRWHGRFLNIKNCQKTEMELFNLSTSLISHGINDVFPILVFTIIVMP
jgi:hypothetical protein